MLYKLTEEDWEMLRRISKDIAFDDANLSRHEILITRRLLTRGLIDACPVEGSDAAVDALWVTQAGREVLGEQEEKRQPDHPAS